MGALDTIPDHDTRALSRVATQFRSTEFEPLVSTFTTEVQLVENALAYLRDAMRNPAVASDVTLDTLGRLVTAQSRGPLTDAQYRLRVNAAVQRNKSHVTIEDLYAIVNAFFPTLAASHYTIHDANSVLGGSTSAWIRPDFFEVSNTYTPTSTVEAIELMRYLARTIGTRLVFSYADVARGSPGTLAKFDTSGYGFDSNKFSGSVDQFTHT